MISRRHLRIKVMQALYSQSLNPELGAKELNQQVKRSIDDHYRLYSYLWFLISQVSAYLLRQAAIKAERKNDPIQLDVRFSTNSIVEAINKDQKTFGDIAGNSESSKAVIKGFYQALSEDAAYQSYLSSKASLDEDKAIVEYFIRKLMAPSEPLDDLLSELGMVWQDDRDNLFSEMLQALERFDDKHKNALQEMAKDTIKEERTFCSDLLDAALKHAETNKQQIGEKLKNWDLDRVSPLDVLLMELALTEFLYCPTIPVKVSLNEYIEISKEYSTPKSKEFINGILDKIMRSLQDSGAIKKTGRGLAT